MFIMAAARVSLSRPVTITCTLRAQITFFNKKHRKNVSTSSPVLPVRL